MPIRNKIVALAVGVGLLLIIIELVRRRKLREEYSWLWLLTGAVILLLTVWFISLHFSVVISRLTDRNRELAQRFALLDLEVRELRERLLPRDKTPS
jgi:hypothetical protein